MAWVTTAVAALTTTASHLALLARPKSYLAVGTAIFTVLTLLLVFSFEPITAHLFSKTKWSSYALSTISAEVCNGTDAYDIGHVNRIPNIVHYVWILKDPAIFSLDFKFFISFYSAYLYFKPDAIYIHTDASPDIFQHANASGDVWTQRILNLPNIRYHQVSPPTETRKGVPIIRLEHRTDFLRMEALYEFGGVYMDSDAVPLRDVADLRNSGFANVVGGAVALTMKHTGKINNGVMMSVPRGTMMNIYIQAAHQFFDGSWAKASVLLLTDLANRLSAIPFEVLVLQPTAFAPTSWEFADQKKLFKPYAQASAINDSIPLSLEQSKTCIGIFNWLESIEKDSTESWEIDFSSTYILHAIDDDIPKIRGWDHKFDVKYILARQSNYARAVYPAIAHAIAAGVIPREDG